MLGIDRHTAKVAWTLILIGIALYLVYSIRSTILVIIFAIFFAYLLFPVVHLIDRHTPRRVPRTVALVLVLSRFSRFSSWLERLSVAGSHKKQRTLRSNCLQCWTLRICPNAFPFQHFLTGSAHAWLPSSANS